METRLAILLAILVVLATVPAPVAAEQTRTGGTIVIGADETVEEDLRAFAGTVIVRGTIDGDLTAFAGNVFVAGEVGGDLEAFAGNVRINGTVAGDVSSSGGNVVLERGGRIGGQFEASGGNVVVDGDVGEDARIAAGNITVGPSAIVGGDFVYDGQLDLADEAQIDGEVRRDSDLQVGGGFGGGPIVPGWVGSLYGFLVNAVLGAVVLLVFPRFSNGVADRANENPLRSGGVGLLLFVGIPILVVLLFVSLVGIPLGLLGLLLYPFLLWIGYVYGAFAVGRWLVELADVDNRWLALLTGLVVVLVVGLVPVVGGLVEFLVLLIGLGALARSLRNRYRGRRTARAGTSAGRPEAAS